MTGRQQRRERERAEEEQEKAAAAEAEAEKRKQEEEEQKAYEALKASFTVEESGTVESQLLTENQGLLAEFIGYITSRKVVEVEEVATQFKLATQDAVRRIVDLEKMGRLSGLMDDRGKFIVVSQAEMEAVARFVNLQGRVSISDLAAKTDELIDLTQNSAPPTADSSQ
eukprot:TRINITY_DN529_c0_g1_i1.p6 TRINITY_DN529_c0_g1~~TRINITY_DN529_c0_g1_i1.p6  ORF type:complete len:169 (+),score=64.25 TRINITY_DN529_c0_g1_i1:540-1046(+)